jgi:hypothetical protein
LCKCVKNAGRAKPSPAMVFWCVFNYFLVAVTTSPLRAIV